MESHYMSSHVQQRVSDTIAFSPTMSLISWSIVGKWHCIFSLQNGLITIYIPTPIQQDVSNSAFFANTLITCHSMTNREWVTLDFFFAMQSHYTPHDQLVGSKWHWFFLCHAVIITFILSHNCNRLWVALILSSQSVTLIILHLWPTVSEWHCIFSLHAIILQIASKWCCFLLIISHQYNQCMKTECK